MCTPSGSGGFKHVQHVRPNRGPNKKGLHKAAMNKSDSDNQKKVVSFSGENK